MNDFTSHEGVSSCELVNRHGCSYLYRHFHNAYLLLLFYMQNKHHVSQSTSQSTRMSACLGFFTLSK